MTLSDTHSLLPDSASSRHTRHDEIDAAFDSDDNDQGPLSSSFHEGPPGYDAATENSASLHSHTRRHQPSSYLFDAGDAMHDELPQSVDSLNRDPLGVTGDEEGDNNIVAAPSAVRTSSNSDRQSAISRHPLNPTSVGRYNFEDASYFSASGRSGRRSRSRSTSFVGSPNSTALGANAQASSSRVALDASMTDAAGAPLPQGASADAQGLARARLLLGRFGRFVGMRVPGANYSSLVQDENNGGTRGASGTVNRSRRVMGGGMNQDGVFGNLNAKPEGRRRRQRNGGGNPDDRGDDDDLEDDILPPTYEVAALDAAPGYWETTIAPGGMGWTPGGAHVGEVEDLILEGLPIGNFFGFAWNLLVSMCFQFVGFLLTYLLHTTHAARCGSRVGLGITLIQYGFYLRTRALQLAEDGSGNGSGNEAGDFGGNFSRNEMHTIELFGDAVVYSGPLPATQAARGWAFEGPTAFLSSSSSTPTATEPSTIASIMASEADGMPPSALDSSSTSTSEWLAYTLMLIGWFVVLSSLLSYWRIHRWGRSLVAASRREQESQRAAENGGEVPQVTEETAPTGFLQRFRAALRARSEVRAAARSSGTGEDWVIFPGSAAGLRGGRVSFSGGVPAATAPGPTIWGVPPRQGTLPFAIDDVDDVDFDEEQACSREANDGDSHFSPEEQRLLRDIRRGGLI